MDFIDADLARRIAFSEEWRVVGRRCRELEGTARGKVGSHLRDGRRNDTCHASFKPDASSDSQSAYGESMGDFKDLRETYAVSYAPRQSD